MSISDFTVLGDSDKTSGDQGPDGKSEKPRRSAKSKEKRRVPSSAGVRGVSWMDRNNDYVSSVGAEAPQPTRNEVRERQPRRDSGERPPRRDSGRPSRDSSNNNNERRGGDENRSFRQDFRGSRVFVQGIPSGVSWQDLKDHFRVAGSVVFASISQDLNTGESKGHGFVQFETTEMALTSIAIMRDHPMNGETLFVRPDLKDEKEGASLKPSTRKPLSRVESKQWECADEENAGYLSDSDQTEVNSLIQARDDARKRRNYQASDSLREELKVKFGVQIDDRLKMWWTSMDGKTVPESIQNLKGEGRWNMGGLKSWNQIPTTPENDACVNPDLVEGLLKQRDVSRREKDFTTADALLEQARTAPDGDLSLRIHDESRTWRIWTDAPPPRAVAPHLSPAERCIAIVEKHAPNKLEEIQSLLERFPGREFNVLKKLKQKYTE